MDEFIWKFVVFVDMLGFADLTEQHEIDYDVFRALDNLNTADFVRVAFEEVGANRLAESYVRFQIALRETVKEAQHSAQLTSISFSDSAFVTFDALRDAMSFAGALMRRLIHDRVPARMGIALGTFLVLRFRADVSLTGGDHAAQFLGTAVVRAHASERCGIKGMRILFHPSSFDPLSIGEPTPEERPEAMAPKCVAVHDSELANRAGVQYEMNYLPVIDSRDQDFVGPVNLMRCGSEPQFHEHHDATLNALSRMRQAYVRNR